MKTLTASFAALVLLPSLSIAQTVDYPDSVLTSPAGQYPVFTPTNGNTVRAQIICPSTFANLPTTPMLVTKVGIQIAGQEPYDTFVGRAGVSSSSTLSANYATNLPDQRVQFDLSGQVLPGGGTQTAQLNQWVEFDICHPFAWKPGDNIVVDITSKSTVAGTYCRTAIGTGVARMLNTAYTTGMMTGTPRASGGIKLRFVFAPLYTPVQFGTGCEGYNGQTPMLTGTGNTKIGSGGILQWDLTQARPNAAQFLALGLNCIDVPTPGGCMIYPDPLILLPGMTSATGTAGSVGVVPGDPTLNGFSVTLQYAIDDPATKASPLSFTLSNGLRFTLNN